MNGPCDWWSGLFFNLQWEWSGLRDQYVKPHHAVFIITRSCVVLFMLFLAFKGIRSIAIQLYRSALTAGHNSALTSISQWIRTIIIVIFSYQHSISCVPATVHTSSAVSHPSTSSSSVSSASLSSTSSSSLLLSSSPAVTSSSSSSSSSLSLCHALRYPLLWFNFPRFWYAYFGVEFTAMFLAAVALVTSTLCIRATFPILTPPHHAWPMFIIFHTCIMYLMAYTLASATILAPWLDKVHTVQQQHAITHPSFSHGHATSGTSNLTIAPLLPHHSNVHADVENGMLLSSSSTVNTPSVPMSIRDVPSLSAFVSYFDSCMSFLSPTVMFPPFLWSCLCFLAMRQTLYPEFAVKIVVLFLFLTAATLTYVNVIRYVCSQTYSKEKQKAQQ